MISLSEVVQLSVELIKLKDAAQLEVERLRKENEQLRAERDYLVEQRSVERSGGKLND